jgi:hypothetical protein
MPTIQSVNPQIAPEIGKQKAEDIMPFASTIVPETGTDLLKKPRTIFTPRQAIKDVNKIQGEVDEISAGMEEQKAKLEEEAKTPPQVGVADYLASQGQPSSFSERAKLAEQYGIQNYTGTAEQNTRLLGILQAQPKPKELSPEEKRAEEMKGAIKGVFTPEQYEAQPYFRRPGETDEQYNARVEELRAEGVPEIQVGEEPAPLTPAEEFKKQIEDYADTIDNAYSKYTDNMNKLRTGAIPLTPEEQAQIDDINRVFGELREQQLTANQNFEKATEIIGIGAGRQRFAPLVHLGNVKQAVDKGIKKISEIESKRLSTINELKMAIRDKNYKMIGEAYDRFREYSADKMKTIEGIYNVARDEQDRIDSIISEQNKLIMEENQRIQERKEDLLEEATKNFAPQEIINAIQGAETIEEAISSAGEYLQQGTGDVGDYLFYKRQQISNGLPYVDYQTFKKSNRTGTQTERDRAMRSEAFSKIMDEFNKVMEATPFVSVLPVAGLKQPQPKEYVPSDKYLELRRQYGTYIGDVDDFDDTFSYLLNPKDRKKYGIGYLKAEEQLSLGEALQTATESFIQYRDVWGLSRKEAERQFMINQEISDIPPLVERVLDDVYSD